MEKLRKGRREIKEILFPQGTRRRRAYDLIRKGIFVIKNQGFRVFLFKVKNYLSRRFFSEQIKYQRYIKENKIDDRKRKIILSKIKEFSYKPLISIITPVYNIDPKILKKTVESVLNQIYENWELCICDDGSTNKKTVDFLKHLNGTDKRIKICFSKRNEGISKASNKALSMAKGEFVAFLDHDDILLPDALYQVVRVLNRVGRFKFIYSDEARIDRRGKVIGIEFKPDFSRFFYLSHPYIVHLVTIEKGIIDEIGGFDEVNFSENVSHDVDLFLRTFSRLKDNEIYHIPKVLYLWRSTENSAGVANKSKIHKYTKFAINRYFESLNINGWGEDGITFNTFKLRFEISKPQLISIIIPTKDNPEILNKCVRSINRYAGYKNYEIIIIANNTKHERTKILLNNLASSVDNVRVFYLNIPFNFSYINNYAVKNSAKGDKLLFLDDDIEFIRENWLRSMVELFEIEDVGIVGAKLIYPDRKIQHAGVIIGLKGLAEHWHKFMNAFINEKLETPGYLSSLNSIREYSAVTGACLMVRRDLFEKVDGFPEDIPYEYNDIDLCLKIRKLNYRVLYTPYALAIHYESFTRKKENAEVLYHPRDRKLFFLKWKELIRRGDPFYNPNLSINSYTPTLKLKEEVYDLNNNS